MTTKFKITDDPSENRHTTTNDEDGNRVDVYDSGGVVDDQKHTRYRPDGSRIRE